MLIKITGSSGYLGGVIIDELTQHGHRTEGIDRHLLYDNTGQLANEIKNANAVIHLAGAPVLQRWTDKAKKEIYDSRIVTTRNLALAIKNLPESQRPSKVVSASGISLYANGMSHNETSTRFDEGFLAALTRDWENAWEALPDSASLTIFRTAVVLGRESATIQKMKLPFKAGVGGKLGNGKQPFPFIHEKDVARAYLMAVENKDMKGVYNLAAPQQINNSEFTAAMSKKLHRPAIIPVPSIALKLLYGQASAILTDSPAVVSQKLSESGFQFRYPDIDSTLDEIFD